MDLTRSSEGVTITLRSLLHFDARRHGARWLGPVTVFLLLAAVMLAAPGTAVSKKQATRTAMQKKLLASAPAENAEPKATGSPSARITLEIFSDYQCPACKQLHFATLRRVVDEYVSTGKVYLIYRDYPLPMHAHARQAARYANAARRLGKFEAVDDALYSTQETWSKTGQIETQLASVLTKTELKKVQELARDPGIDAGIEREVQLARQQQVNQTPTMVITANGKVFRVAGVVQYEVLRRFLDSLLE